MHYQLKKSSFVYESSWLNSEDVNLTNSVCFSTFLGLFGWSKN